MKLSGCICLYVYFSFSLCDFWGSPKRIVRIRRVHLLDIVVFFKAFPVGRDNVIDVLEASILASFNPEPNDTSWRPPADMIWGELISTLAFFWAGLSFMELFELKSDHKQNITLYNTNKFQFIVGKASLLG